MALVAAILLAVLVVPSPWGIPLVAGAAVLEAAESFLLLRWSRRRRAQAGVEAMIGAEAQVVDERFVRVGGELWQARGLAGRPPGELVRVRRVEGLFLEVE